MWQAVLIPFHISVSIIGIISGGVVVVGFIRDRSAAFWTPLFLATTTLTMITGFLIPFERVLPSHIFGIVSLITLAFVITGYALQQKHGLWNTARWRRTVVLGSVFVLYLNTLVLTVQLFSKVPALHALAPNLNERPFLFCQLLLLLSFLAMGTLSVRTFQTSLPLRRIRRELTRQPVLKRSES